MDFTHHHGHIDSLDAYDTIAIDALDVYFLPRIVGPDYDRRLLVDLFYGKRNTDALVVRAGVDDDLGGIFDGGALQHVLAGWLTAHKVDEVGKRISLRPLRT